MDIAVVDFYEEHQWGMPFKNVTKIDEIPFDFSRRRLTVVVNADDHQLMITKGAVEKIEEACTHTRINDEIIPSSTAVREELRWMNVQMNK